MKTIQSVKRIPPTTNGFEGGSCEPDKWALENGRKASRSREWSLTNRYEWKGHLSPTTTRKLIHKIWVDFISMEGNMEKVGHLMSVGEAMD